MNFDELLEQKKNIFDHVFYEFLMFNDTYHMLLGMTNNKETEKQQFWINVLLESHAVHLRNLIHFFSGKDSLNATTLLNINPKLGISNAEKKNKIIDRAISHLLIERAELTNDEENLTVEMNNLIKEMFPEISLRIKSYLTILQDKESIKHEYHKEFYEKRIQEMYKVLQKMYK